MDPDPSILFPKVKVTFSTQRLQPHQQVRTGAAKIPCRDTMTSVVGMVVTIQTNLETSNPVQSIVSEQTLEKTFLEFPKEDDRRACLLVKMLMLDGC